MFEELLNLLDSGEHLAVLGPRAGGKTLILAELARRIDEHPAHSRPRIVRLQRSDKRLTSEEGLLELIKNYLEFDEAEFRELSGGIPNRLIEAVRRAGKRLKRPIWFFVQDVLSIPKPIARQLLSFFQEAKEEFNREISVIVAGSDDFIPLTYDERSPYRHARKILVNGMDHETAKHFFCRRRSRQIGNAPTDPGIKPVDEDVFDKLITKPAFDLLYHETGGNPHFIQEIIVSTARYPHTLDPSKLARRWDTEQCRKAIDMFVHDFMPADLFCQQTIAKIERNSDAFDRLRSILLETSHKSVKSPGRPGPLEVSGLVIREPGCPPRIACPVWKNFLKRHMSPRYLADVYALQRRWSKAWEAYQAPGRSAMDRPLAGESRSRLAAVIIEWEQSFDDYVHDGPKAVHSQLETGLRQLLNFADCRWQNDHESPTAAIPTGKEEDNAPTEDHPWTIDCGADSYGNAVFLNGTRTRLRSAAHFKQRLRPDVDLAIYLEREGDGREIDLSEQKTLKRVLQKFWLAYQNAQEIVYAKTIGELREAHLQVIDRLSAELISTPFDMETLVNLAGQGLINSKHYHRIMISLVDGKCEWIQAVGDWRHKSAKPVAHETNLPLTTHTNPAISGNEKEWDIQQWVVQKNETKVIADATLPTNSNPTTQWNKAAQCGMAAITVMPMRVRGDVIGSIHIERADRRVPSDEELQLFEILARQYGVLFRHAQRLTMLEKSLHRLDSRLILMNANKQSIFINLQAAEEGFDQRLAGWQHDKPKWTGYPLVTACCKDPITPTGKPEHIKSPTELIKTIENHMKGREVNYRYIGMTDDGVRAFDWLLAPVDDFRENLAPPFQGAKSRIGYVEKVFDLTPDQKLLMAMREWFGKSNTKSTTDAVLAYFREEGYQWCRLYRLKSDSAKGQFFESLAQYGLKQSNNILNFNHQRIQIRRDDREHGTVWKIVDGNQPTMIRINKGIDHTEPPVETDLFGWLHAIEVPEISEFDRENLEKDVLAWVDAPLVIGDELIGLLCVSAPEAQIYTPQKWQHLGSVVIGVATALAAAFSREEKEHAVELTWKKAAAMVVHQLSNCIRGIEGAIDLAKMHISSPAPDEDTVHEDLNDAKSGIDKAMEIIRDSDRYASDKPFKDIAVFQWEEFEHKLRKTALPVDNPPLLKIELDEKLSCARLKSSLRALIEIFELLATNSRIHSGKLGADLSIAINVRWNDQGETKLSTELGAVTFFYRDNGRGVKPEMKEKLFLPWHTESSQGSGLGMAIAANFVNRLDGTILLDENFADGAGFILNLPNCVVFNTE